MSASASPTPSNGATNGSNPNQNGNVNGFLIKLWRLLENSCDNTIVWSDDGRSFIISDPHAFSNSLSKYFKHSKLSSFIRQLNMYGFRKVTSNINWTAGSDIKVEDDLHFYHPNFRRGEQNQLALIRRKMPSKYCSAINGNHQHNHNHNNSSTNGVTHICHEHNQLGAQGILEHAMSNINGGSNGSSFDLNEIRNALNEVRILDVRQTETTNSIQELKHENETLWTELLDLRTKYNEQRDIITTLIKFIVDSIQSRFPVSKNRKVSNLMIGNMDTSGQLATDVADNQNSSTNNQATNILSALIVPSQAASCTSNSSNQSTSSQSSNGQPTSGQSTSELSTWFTDQLANDREEACKGLENFLDLFDGLPLGNLTE